MSADDDNIEQPSRSDYAGKLPDEFFHELVKCKEKFEKEWEQAKSFDIQIPYLAELIYDEPFLGSLSRRITKIRTTSVSTTGVAIVNDYAEMLWNPIFFSKFLTSNQVAGVIKHELFHVILEHLTKRRQQPFILWNVATDCAINSLIKRNELPDFSLIPGELYRPKNAKHDWKPSLIARKVEKFPKGKSSEWYMNALLDDDEIKKTFARAKARISQANAGDQNDAGGDISKDEQLIDELFGDAGGQFDNHDVWDDITDEERDILRDATRDILRDCVREAESKFHGWGSVPASIQQYLRKIVSNSVSWKELLSQFVGRSRSSTTTTSIKRINRRYPWEHPGRKRAHSAKPIIALDQSGSMTNQFLEILFAEISNVGSIVEFTLIPFDSSVDEKNIQIIKKHQQPLVSRTRCGGTDFDAVVKYINSKIDAGMHMGDCLVIITDGECCKPSKCKIPVAYVLAPKQKLRFTPDDDDVVISVVF
jgi:predicted metal-dependent peptidase